MYKLFTRVFWSLANGALAPLAVVHACCKARPSGHGASAHHPSSRLLAYRPPSTRLPSWDEVEAALRLNGQERTRRPLYGSSRFIATATSSSGERARPRRRLGAARARNRAPALLLTPRLEHARSIARFTGPSLVSPRGSRSPPSRRDRCAGHAPLRATCPCTGRSCTSPCRFRCKGCIAPCPSWRWPC